MQVVIGVIASAFAFLWTYSVYSAFNMTMRSALAGRRTRLDHLRLYISMSRHAVDTNLSARLVLVSILFCAVALLPTWLWTGALTPQLISVSHTTLVVAVKTGSDSYPFLQYLRTNIVSQNCSLTTQSNGSFTNCPGINFSGRIVDTINSASTADGIARNHTKIDNTGYNYVNRSYGAGAAVGLLDLPVSGSVERYYFTEIGYVTSATCSFNETSAWGFSEQKTNNGVKSGEPNIWYANGRRPNDNWTAGADGDPTFFAQVAFNNDPVSVVAFSAGSSGGFQNGTGPFFLSMVAGQSYSFLNQTQCAIVFTPSVLNVTVSVANRTIQVSPETDSTAVTDPEPRGELREWALRALQALSMVQTTLYVSMIGEAFANNIVTKVGDPSFNRMAQHNQTIIPAIEDAVEAVMDDIFSALGGYSLTQPGGFSSDQPATYEASAAQIGTWEFHIALLIINLAALTTILVVTVYTRVFDDSPAFDFADLGALVAGVSNGFTNAERRGIAAAKLTEWRGDPADPALRTLALQLDCKLGADRATCATVL